MGRLKEYMLDEIEDERLIIASCQSWMMTVEEGLF